VTIIKKRSETLDKKHHQNMALNANVWHA